MFFIDFKIVPFKFLKCGVSTVITDSIIMRKFYTLFVGFMFFFLSQGQISQLNNPLMYGGKIQGYAKNSSCVMVTTDGGIFKTTDQGVSWTNVTTNFNPLSVQADKIVSLGNDFYVESSSGSGSVIYKSSDNGATWISIPYGLNNWYTQSLGKIGNTLYTIGVDPLTSGNSGKLYSSIDGITWTPKSILWSNFWPGGNLSLLSFNQDKLYIILQNNLYYTQDGNTINTVSVNGLGITNFSDNSDNFGGDALGNLYCRSQNSIYKYNFTTLTWTNISTGKIPANYQILEFSVTDNTMFFVALPEGGSMKFYKSTDQGSTIIEQTATGLTTPLVTNIIQVSSTNFIGNNLYDEILVSSTGGSSWSASTNQFTATNAGDLTLSGNNLLFSTSNRGILLSTNKGAGWTADNTGIPGFGGIAYFVNQIAQAKDTLFSFLQPDPFSDNIVLYKSSDSGISWSPKPIPAPYSSGNEYSFAGKCDSALFVNYYDPSTSKYALIVTFNNGTSWVKPASQNSDQVTFIKGSKNYLFAFNAYSHDWSNFNNVYRVNNFGMSFIDIGVNYLFQHSLSIKRIVDKNGDKGEAIMDVDPSSNKAIFAVFNTNHDGLLLFNTSTNVWSELTSVGLPESLVANYLKFIGNNTWLLATNVGLYISSNGGLNWRATHTATTWQTGVTVNSIQLLNNKVFLGTAANGIWVVDLTTGIVEPLAQNELMVYPNPGRDIVQVTIPEFNGLSAGVSLYSMDGKVMMTKTATGKFFQLDMHNLSSGTYFLVINSNNRLYRKTVIRN